MNMLSTMDIESGLPFVNFPHVNLLLLVHGPEHVQYLSPFGYLLIWDHYPVLTGDVVIQFLIHCLQEMISIRCPPLKNSSSLYLMISCLQRSQNFLGSCVAFLKTTCLHVSFTAYESFYKLSKNALSS